MNWAIHLCLITGVSLGFELVDEDTDRMYFVIDLFIFRIGIEIEKTN